MNSNKVTHAAIVGQQGGIWGSSPGFEFSEADVLSLIKAYEDLPKTQGQGIRIAGVKYFTLQADARSIYGKLGLKGIVVVKTIQAIVVGVYQEPLQPAQTTPVIEKVADNLIAVNY